MAKLDYFWLRARSINNNGTKTARGDNNSALWSGRDAFSADLSMGRGKDIVAGFLFLLRETNEIFVAGNKPNCVIHRLDEHLTVSMQYGDLT